MSTYKCIVEVPVYDPPLTIANSSINSKDFGYNNEILTHIAIIWSCFGLLIDISNSWDYWNRYTYVRNNPVNLTDPSGMSPVAGKTGNEVARYIVQRMREDSNSKEIREMLKLNSTHSMRMTAIYTDKCRGGKKSE